MDEDQIALFYYLEGFTDAFFFSTISSIFANPYTNNYQYGYETATRLRQFQQSINEVNNDGTR